MSKERGGHIGTVARMLDGKDHEYTQYFLLFKRDDSSLADLDFGAEINALNEQLVKNAMSVLDSLDDLSLNYSDTKADAFFTSRDWLHDIHTFLLYTTSYKMR